MARWTTLLLALALSTGVAQGCLAQNVAAADDNTTGLTLTGPGSALDTFLRAAERKHHAWVVEKRWSHTGGLQSLRLRWPKQPSLLDVGSIVWLTQEAQANHLTISETHIVETQR